jgi:hypothetical protein
MLPPEKSSRWLAAPVAGDPSAARAHGNTMAPSRQAATMFTPQWLNFPGIDFKRSTLSRFDVASKQSVQSFHPKYRVLGANE